MSFVHLHIHSQYSFLDGAIKIDDLIKRVKELGMDSVALTDHGGMFGAMEFYIKAMKNHIKPIIGMEGYFVYRDRTKKDKDESPYHILLIAKNETGYKNLMKISSYSYIDGFYKKPRLDTELIEKYHDGLIVSSACLQGILSKDIKNNKIEKAYEHAKYFKDLIGEDFYIEIMRVGAKDEKRVNEELLNISRKYNIPIIATNDCHYLRREDAEAHDTLLAVQTKKVTSDENRMRFPSSEFYLKSPEEMKEVFRDLPEAIENTIKIRDKVTTIPVERDKYYMPKFEIPKEYSSPYDYLEKLTRDGLIERLGKIDKRTEERLNYELSVIQKMKFSGYFLIIRDIVKSARERGILVGPGRGSAASSIVLYGLGITDINPLDHNLLFERFLNPERISMPDVDIDFEDERRDEVIDYIREKYGKKRVAQIVSFSVLKAKAVVRDVGRVMEIPAGDVDRIAKMIDSPTLAEAIENSNELKRLVNSRNDLKKLIEISEKLEGLTRHHSIHASGVVITPEDIENLIPVCASAPNKNGKIEIKTQYDMDILEKLGFLKVDILGLNTLSVINNTLKFINEDIDMRKLDKNDKSVYELLSKGDTVGVFQLEEGGARNILRKFKPKNFSEVVLVLALIRPGPLQQIDLAELFARKEGKKKITYSHPKLKSILEETYGYPLFQEQAMRLAKDVAGFSWGEADRMRKAMGKKIYSMMHELREKFVQGAENNGIPSEKAEDLFSSIETFASYAFNKSHSTVYAELSFRTAYLKAHYLTEFLAANMTSEMENTDKLKKYILDAKKHNIEVFPPDINESSTGFIPMKNKIMYGLAAIKNVGVNAVGDIVEERKKGPYKDFNDFLERTEEKKVNKKVIENLIKAGAFDKLNTNRRELLLLLQNRQRKSSRETRVYPLFSEEQQPANGFKVEKPTEDELRIYEQEAFGFYFKNHPMESYSYYINSLITSSSLLEEMPEEKLISCGGTIVSIKSKKGRNGGSYIEMYIEDLEGIVRVTVSERVAEKFEAFLTPGTTIAIKGKISRMGNKLGVRAEEIVPFDQVIKRVKKAFVIIDLEDTDESKLNDLFNIIKGYKGRVPLYFLFREKENQLRIRTSTRVRPEVPLIESMKEHLGEGNFRLVF